jgi:SnoaL-like domain
MSNLNNFFQDLYKNFNDRKIDLVISKMTDDVKWANGMDGGYVYGRNAVRDYWTRQFTMISSNVTPLEIETENGISKIKAHQVVHDLNGNLLADEFVYHFFHIRENKIALFEIGEKIKN